MNNYTCSGKKVTSKAGAIYVGVQAQYRRRKAPMRFGGYFAKTAKDLHRQELHRSQQYHRRLHPGPAQSTWTSFLRTLESLVMKACIFFFCCVLHTIFSHFRAHAFARSITVTRRSSAVQTLSSRRQERRWAIVCGSPQSQSMHRLSVGEIAPSPQHCFRTAHSCAQSVKSSPTEPVLSRSSRQRLGHLQSRIDGGWHVCQAVFPEPQTAAKLFLFRDFNLLAAGWWWNSWCLSFVVCVPCGRQQSSWCEEGQYRPVGVHCPSSLVWGSPWWFGSRRVGPGSACARV